MTPEKKQLNVCLQILCVLIDVEVESQFSKHCSIKWLMTECHSRKHMFFTGINLIPPTLHTHRETHTWYESAVNVRIRPCYFPQSTDSCGSRAIMLVCLEVSLPSFFVYPWPYYVKPNCANPVWSIEGLYLIIHYAWQLDLLTQCRPHRCILR